VNGFFSQLPRWRRGALGLRWASLLALCLAFCASAAQAALTPESPEVKAAVDKGVAFLKEYKTNEVRIGARAIAALALVKNNVPLDHPKIQEAVRSIRTGITDGSLKSGPESLYSLGMSIIFLCNADPEQYRRDIEKLLEIQAQTQKAEGGWGYENVPNGDTSMTQYAVLSMWEAQEAGFDIPTERWEKVANWLLRTQDPNGGFGYQATDPGTFERVAQSEVRLSMCAAGAGSLYICSDRFGMVNLGPGGGEEEDDVPDELKEVGGSSRRKRRKVASSNVDRSRMGEAREDADDYLDKNFTVEVPMWIYYYLYAMERYQSFREAADGRMGAESAWYDSGAKYLISKQNEQGAWSERCGEVADTAFSVLFLIRSTRKSITKARYFGGGTLVGGRGLPSGEGAAFVRSGRVKKKALAGPADELFAAMDNPDNDQFNRALDDLEEMSFDADAEELNKQATKLKKLVADGPPEARVAAVRSLARTRDLDHVPTLIFALEDPDAEVFREAVSGLRFLSRRLTDDDVPTDPNEEQRREAINEWRRWFLEIRPGAQFETTTDGP
jgi:hypothetical protein